MSESAGEVEVLSGAASGGLRWHVLCSGDDEDLYTRLRIYSGNQCVVAGSGFGGPKLPLGAVMNEWRGRTADLPPGHLPASIRAERDGTVLEERPQRMPPPFPRR